MSIAPDKPVTETEFSLASQQYLRPTTDVGNAILRLTVEPKGEHFICEIFEPRLTYEPYIDADGLEKMREIEHAMPPKAIEAQYFIKDRFRHGAVVVSRQGCMHEIWRVPITDYTVMLIQKAWTGQKRISENAKPFFHKIFLREFQAEQNAKRTARFKNALERGKELERIAQAKAGHIIEQAEAKAQHFSNDPLILAQVNTTGTYIADLLSAAQTSAKQLIDTARTEAIQVVEDSVPRSEWFTKYAEHLKEIGWKQNGEPIEMKAYQRVGAYNACLSNGYGFLCDPGLGKTLMMICKMDYTISHSINSDNTERTTTTLIVCPKNVRANWVSEIHKFSMYGENGQNKLFITMLTGNTATDRAINLITEISSDEAEGKHVVIICGYEGFVQTPKLQEMFEYDLLLADESHNFANPGTKRTKTFIEYRGKFHNAVIATGTFFRNTPFDGYGQLEILHPGASGFDNFTAFKTFYGMYIPNQYNGRQKLAGFDTERIPLLQEKLARYTFIMKKEDALPFLPAKTYSILECGLGKEQLKVYRQLQDELAAQIESYGPEPDSITVNNILTQMLRLAQITSGYAATDAGTLTRFDPNPKLDLLVRYLKGSLDNSDDEEGSNDEEGILNDPNRKCLIWCTFRENVKMVHQRLALEGIKSVIYHGETDNKEDVVQTYNCDPETRVFIGIVKSGGVGLNLVGFDPAKPSYYKTNTTDVIHYSSNWSYVERTQANDRAHRYITRVPVHILDLLVPRSIDMEIYERVKAKGVMGASMQDIKRILTAMVPQVG